MISLTIDGVVQEATSGERLIDVINRTGVQISQVCYHPQLGPIQTCDTCMVEINGQLMRACATSVSAGMKVLTKSEKAGAAQREAFDPHSHQSRSLLAPCATTTTETAPFTTPKDCSALNINQFHIVRSLTKRIIPTPSTATTHNNAFFAADVSKLARTCR